MTKRLSPEVKAARKAARHVPSDIIVCGDLAYVKLSQGLTATIDAGDVPLVHARRWAAVRRFDGRAFYAVSGHGEQRVWMHRLIVDAERGQDVDHEDGDGLNNRRGNLRAATRAENSRNQRRRRNSRSGFKGVTWHKLGGRWAAQITANGKNHYLGLFDTPEAAHAAYVAASHTLHGQFARAA